MHVTSAQLEDDVEWAMGGTASRDKPPAEVSLRWGCAGLPFFNQVNDMQSDSVPAISGALSAKNNGIL